MVRDSDHGLLAESSELTENSIPLCLRTERSSSLLFARIPVEPTLCEDRHDPVAHFPFCNAVIDRNDLARTVRKRDRRQFHLRVVSSRDDHKVAIIQRRCSESDEHFSGFGFRIGTVRESEIVYTKFLDLVCFHISKTMGRHQYKADRPQTYFFIPLS